MNFPILSTLIFLPLISSLFIFLSKENKNTKSAIYISLFSSLATFVLSLFIWHSLDSTSSDFQFLEEKSWINDFIKFKLGFFEIVYRNLISGSDLLWLYRSPSEITT